MGRRYSQSGQSPTQSAMALHQLALQAERTTGQHPDQFKIRKLVGIVSELAFAHPRATLMVWRRFRRPAQKLDPREEHYWIESPRPRNYEEKEER